MKIGWKMKIDVGFVFSNGQKHQHPSKEPIGNDRKNYRTQFDYRMASVTLNCIWLRMGIVDAWGETDQMDGNSYSPMKLTRKLQNTYVSKRVTYDLDRKSWKLWIVHAFLERHYDRTIRENPMQTKYHSNGKVIWKLLPLPWRCCVSTEKSLVVHFEHHLFDSISNRNRHQMR